MQFLVDNGYFEHEDADINVHDTIRLLVLLRLGDNLYTDSNTVQHCASSTEPNNGGTLGGITQESILNKLSSSMKHNTYRGLLCNNLIVIYEFD